MKLQFHFGTAVPVLSAPLQFPRGALSSTISQLHFATLKRETAAPPQAMPPPAVSNTEKSEGPSAAPEELLASIGRNSIF